MFNVRIMASEALVTQGQRSLKPTLYNIIKNSRKYNKNRNLFFNFLPFLFYKMLTSSSSFSVALGTADVSPAFLLVAAIV